MRDECNDPRLFPQRASFPSDARSIRHTETYNVIVRIYIYRLASILQSNVIYEGGSSWRFQCRAKAVREKIGYVTNNVHTATVKNDRRLTKRLPLNRATDAIHHYLVEHPVRLAFYTTLSLSLSLSLLSHLSRISLFPFGLRSLRLHYLTTAL